MAGKARSKSRLNVVPMSRDSIPTREEKGAYDDAISEMMEQYKAGKASAWEIVKKRHEEGLPTVLTSNDSLAKLAAKWEAGKPDVAEQLASRIHEGPVIRIDGADRRKAWRQK